MKLHLVWRSFASELSTCYETDFSGGLASGRKYFKRDLNNLHREQAAKVGLPVVPSGDDNPLLHAVILDGAYSCSYVEVCCGGQIV